MTFLHDKVAIVTGAGSGIGKAICRTFAEAGAKVVLNDMNPELAQESALDINNGLTGIVHPIATDVADIEATRTMIKQVIEMFGRLDILVGNAGLTNFGAFLDYSEVAFDRVIGVNLRGNYFLAQAAAREMIRLKTREGRIILTSSVTGHRAFLNLSAYGISKAALVHLSRVLALELGKFGITTNTISPGAILTSRTLKDDPEFEQRWASVSSNGSCGTVEDIANTALFLASSEARHINGQTIQVDGGWTIMSPVPEGLPDQPQESSKLI